MDSTIKNFPLPNVSRLGSGVPLERKIRKDSAEVQDFEKLLKAELAPAPEEDVEISAHALRRINERNMDMDSEELLLIQRGLEKLKSKGSKDSLILTARGAYIVDVDKNRVVTAMDRGLMRDNVFTKIDSTVLMD